MKLYQDFSLLAPLMMVGSLSLIDINNYQAGGISNWIVWSQPLAFILFVIAGFAETNRTPFDLLEHEAELVAGYATEYSGMRWGCSLLENMRTFYNFIFNCTYFLGGFNIMVYSRWISNCIKSYVFDFIFYGQELLGHILDLIN